MAKGAVSKASVTEKILEVFEGAFINEKEIRIPMIEDGQEVQIKVTLTCAKTNLDRGGEVSLAPTTSAEKEGSVVADWDISAITSAKTAPTPKITEPTEEEKENVANLLAGLGL